jgi:hypothetical protein
VDFAAIYGILQNHFQARATQLGKPIESQAEEALIRVTAKLSQAEAQIGNLQLIRQRKEEEASAHVTRIAEAERANAELTQNLSDASRGVGEVLLANETLAQTASQQERLPSRRPRGEDGLNPEEAAGFESFVNYLRTLGGAAGAQTASQQGNRAAVYLGFWWSNSHTLGLLVNDR